MFCFVIINSFLFHPFMFWSCFIALTVIPVSEFCVTTHWHHQEHQGSGSVTTHWLWHHEEHQGLHFGLCHNTLTAAGTPRLGLCHNTLTDTSKNTKAWAVSQHIDTSKNTKAWAVSQHNDWHQQEHQGLGCVTTHWHQQEHQGLGCVATHWHQQEHQGLGCVTTHWLTPARTPRLGLCHNTLTLTPARTNTKAAFKCYALHNYVGTIIRHDKRLA